MLDEWAPTPKFYDLNNGAFDEIEEMFVPFSIGTQLEMQSAGNTNCWRDAADQLFQDFLNSDCVWIQFWVELRDARARSRRSRASSTTTCASRRRSGASSGR